MGACKIHALKIKAAYPTIQESYTYCGKSGTQDRCMTSEYITMDGQDARFEVAVNGEKPTCKRCVSIMEKESIAKALAKPGMG